MKTLTTGVIAASVLLAASAAHATDRSARSTPSPTLTREAKAPHHATPADAKAIFLDDQKMFLWRLHWVNHSEIQAGELGQAKSKRLATFGETVMNDHRDAENELLTLAEKKEIDLELNAEEYAKVRDLLSHEMTAMMDLAHDGEAFERKYLEHMTMGHAEVLEMVKTFRKKTTDTEIRAYLDRLVPTLQRHEKEAKAMLEEIGGERRDVRGEDKKTRKKKSTTDVKDPAEQNEKKRTTTPDEPEDGTDAQEDIEEKIEEMRDPTSGPDSGIPMPPQKR